MILKQISAIIKNNIKLKKVGQDLARDSDGYFLSFAFNCLSNQPNSKIVDISLLAINRARSVDLSDINNRFLAEYAGRMNNWPGEHYRLLAAVVDVVKPKIIIEIGTHKGASALVMKKFITDDAKLVTYDVVPWSDFSDTGLKEADFKNNLEQRVIDLSVKEKALGERATLESADLIFVDAAKDGKMEQDFCDLFDSLKFKNRPLIIFDDIRMLNMIKIWNDIKHPKLDLTSFGHWSGTGLVEWI